MRTWQIATVIFFVYIGFAAALVPRLATRKRMMALAGASAGIFVVLAATLTPPHPILENWIVPPVVLLMAYWTSGLLFVAPMPRAERILMRLDELLQVRRLAAAAPRPLAEFLEFSYAAVYPTIPIALAIYLTANGEPDASRFWSVILITDYICFGMLPWIQTRAPRSLETGEPWKTSLRALNLRLLGRTSIQVNTFPSGHAAEALAAALLVIGAPMPVVIWMFLNALAISAATVFGRYHYAADALAGWAVAAGVWIALRG